MIIEPAELFDCDEILILQKLSYFQEAKIYDDYNIPPLKQSIDEIKEEFSSSTFLKASIDSKIVGSVRASLKDGICYINKLIVDPQFQNKGIGTKLLNEIQKFYIDKGIKSFELFTGEKSLKNISLYEKNGFKIIEKRALSHKVNLVIMKKELNP